MDQDTSDKNQSPKAIVLFSDGTGNGSGKLFKTNVWRMYEAVDLGPTTADKRKQIAFYDNGVGTSNFPIFAAIAGVFGFGLNRNVLEIYRYACRNYTPGKHSQAGAVTQQGGDEIYAFGFSRGAFTIRTLIAFIASQGLVRASSEAELLRRSRDAYLAFKSADTDSYARPPRMTRALRFIRNVFLKIWRASKTEETYDQAANFHPVIRFVGVWDTVSAYGGPIVEITRAIDNWIYPLSMPNYRLSHKVQRARHALAIDDERDAFHPLLWDEVNEEKLVAAGLVDRDRLQQVWFAGMHADVGGGYPDESLSYISFLWMLHEARQAGLRTLRSITDRFRALANSEGPIHDSRSGPGAYYRYQPRHIGAWMHPPKKIACRRSIVLDPQWVDENGKQQGMLTRVQVHESVIARISRNSGYAPFTLPARLCIVPEIEGETTPQRYDLTPEEPAGEERTAPALLTPLQRARVQDAEVGQRRIEAMVPVLDLVWHRRWTYFLTLIATLVLVLMPLWIDWVPIPLFLPEVRNFIGELIRLLTIVTPEFVNPLIETFAENSLHTLALGLLIYLLMRHSKSLETRLRDLARRAWRESLADSQTAHSEPSEPARSLSKTIRTSALYRWPLRYMKWHVIPLLTVILIILAIFWLFPASYTQLRLPSLERDKFCPYSADFGPIEKVRFDFQTSKTCVPAERIVRKGERYVLEMKVKEKWQDGGTVVSKNSLEVSTNSLRYAAGYAGIPFRRMISAGYLQPVIAVREASQGARKDDQIYMKKLTLELQDKRPNVWRTTFVAPATGALAIFSNDIVVADLLNPNFFYQEKFGKNSGSACVTIWAPGFANQPPQNEGGEICIAVHAEDTNEN